MTNNIEDTPIDRGKEFRFVIDDIVLCSLNPIHEYSVDFTDYYFSREKRVRIISRHSQKNNPTYQLIQVTPGSITKPTISLTEYDARKLAKEATLIVEKKGIGELVLPGGYQGYAEHVKAYLPGKEGRPIIDESHIEFELEGVSPDLVAESFKPKRIIRKGLWDYINDCTNGKLKK